MNRSSIVIKWLIRWFPMAFGIIVIGLIASRSIDFYNQLVIAAFLCIFGGFATTALLVAPRLKEKRDKLNHERTLRFLENKMDQAKKTHKDEEIIPLKGKIFTMTYLIGLQNIKEEASRTGRRKTVNALTSEIAEESKEAPSTEEEPESPAVILGYGGVYGIIAGLGISDALDNYSQALSTGLIGHFNSTIRDHLINNTVLPGTLIDLVGEVPFDWGYAFRLVGFLVTILPFIHGTIITFSNKWYSDGKENHYGVAFIFFIVAFVHTVLFFFMALNLQNIALFLLYLFALMILNTVWIPIQTALTKKYLTGNIFGNEWTILSFNTLAFILVFIYAIPSLITGTQNIGNESWPNFLILVVLFSRSLADYAVGWKLVYNRAPS